MTRPHAPVLGRSLSGALPGLRCLAALLPLVACGLTFAQATSANAPTPAAPSTAQRLQVTAPFLELHTGPGRGYPVFFVVERQQWVAVELRRTDWYRVRAEGGQVGWVPRAQLETTLAEGGSGLSFRELLVDEAQARQVSFGGAMGRFQTEPMLKLWLHARLADTLGAELTVGQVQGLYSGTDFWHVALTSEPWSDQRLSPFVSVGLGRFANLPNRSLVESVPTHAQLGHATVGLRWRIGERYLARVDWSLYTAFVSDARSTEYRALTAGLGFHF